MMNFTRTVLSVSVVLALACGAWGQVGAAPGMTFSVDFQGPSAGGPGPATGVPEGFGVTFVDEGSILTPALPGAPGPNPPTLPGPLPAPGVMVGSIPGAVGSIPGGLGIVPEPIFGAIELDALSYGRDFGEEVAFSVDEFAMGLPLAPAPPNVTSEGILAGVFDAAADVFAYAGPFGPVAPLGPTFGNTGIIDGDALPSASGAVYPGSGLIEPNPPSPLALPDSGDNLDAVDVNTGLNDVTGPIYLSLSSAFADPLEPSPPANGGTAAANGFVGGDVLVTSAGAFPALYAPAPLLGLDIVGGPDSDDLDALALLENGDGAFTPGVDFILFSVRRGSAVIGAPDSMFGVPIEEGDILTVPMPGGATPFPAIFIPGEAMGLVTLRAFPGGGQFGADDLDALDVIPEPATISLMAAGALALVRRRRR